MNKFEWIAMTALYLALLILTAAGFYRAGYAKGYLASHKIVLEINENFLQVLAIAKRYERKLKELEESYRYSRPPGVK